MHKNILKIIKKRKYLAIIIVIIAVITSYFLFKGEKKPKIETITAKRGIIVQEVTVTGNTKPIEEVDLAFEKSGKIVKIYAKVGDQIGIGERLLELDRSELITQLLDAEASLASQNAKLSELRRGSRLEDIQISETALKKAEQDLLNYYMSTPTILNDAYTKADDAVRKQIDDLFINDEDINPKLTYSISDSQLKNNVESQRFLASNELKNWKNELGQISEMSSRELLGQSIQKSKNHLNTIRNFLNATLATLSAPTDISQATITTYKGYLNTAITNVSTAISNVNSQEQDIASQSITVEKTRDELNLKLAGSIPEQIMSQEALVKQAEAKVQTIQVQIEKTVLRSPIKGVVTKQDGKLGEIASANSAIVSVISEGQLEIETFIPEVDIAKVKVGDDAIVTLDAYTSDVKFEAKVVAIDPAATTVEGVSTYKTTLQFKNEDQRIKPGFTANVDILTDKRENAISIPQRSVIEENGKEFVRVLKENQIEKAEVQTGLRGSDGNIEITEGINEGDRVITFIEI